MKINRRGSGSDRGPSSVEIDKPKISWDQNSESVEIIQSRVRDFSTKSMHDYTISISMSEMVQIIKVLGNLPVNDSQALLSEKLSPCLRELIRLQKACIGPIGNNKNIESENE